MQTMKLEDVDLERKFKEAEFHDRRERLQITDAEEYARITQNKRFYSITQSSVGFMHEWFATHCANGAEALDYCCGGGPLSLEMARYGARVTGIDISAASIDTARARLAENGFAERSHFVVGDAENTDFPDSSFDVIFCGGVLHHLDVTKAYPELARILKPGGAILCSEALAHNPVFQMYRRKTPHMRTEWEVDHILSRREIEFASQYFDQVTPHFFHLAALAAVPLRNRPGLFDAVLRPLDALDRVILKFPGLRWWAWQCHFVLAKPKK
jgi:ubiquinone/menaquinone biosynthesis C-methylase UbiE